MSLIATFAAQAGPTNSILFVTQVPIQGFHEHCLNVRESPCNTGQLRSRGDLYVLYPDGATKNLTRVAGYGQWGSQFTNGIAVRQPCVHWSGNKAVFSMVVGAPRFQYDYTSVNYWQLYEITNFTDAAAVPIITKVPNQPTNYNNVSPIYGTDDRIIFTSDRPRNGIAIFTRSWMSMRKRPRSPGYGVCNLRTGISFC